jgi:UTP--glucose-1-phosphate uridylyltransferase
MSQAVRKAIFPVGGLGTRFLPATKAMPKEMLPVVDKPLIQYAVEEARAAGIEQFIFVTGRGKTAIEDHFDYSAELHHALISRDKHDLWKLLEPIVLPAGQVSYTRQPEPLGLGHAVWCARHLVGDEPFAVLLADDLILAAEPCLKQMIDAHAKRGGNMVAVMDVAREHTSRYGIVDPMPGAKPAADDRLVGIKGLVEKPRAAAAPSTLAVIGRYILQPTVFDSLGRQVRGAGGGIQLAVALADLIGGAPFHGLRFAGRRFDCGDKVGFLEANIAFALERADMGPQLRDILNSYRG